MDINMDRDVRFARINDFIEFVHWQHRYLSAAEINAEFQNYVSIINSRVWNKIDPMRMPFGWCMENRNRGFTPDHHRRLKRAQSSTATQMESRRNIANLIKGRNVRQSPEGIRLNNRNLRTTHLRHDSGLPNDVPLREKVVRKPSKIGVPKNRQTVRNFQDLSPRVNEPAIRVKKTTAAVKKLGNQKTTAKKSPVVTRRKNNDTLNSVQNIKRATSNSVQNIKPTLKTRNSTSRIKNLPPEPTKIINGRPVRKTRVSGSIITKRPVKVKRKSISKPVARTRKSEDESVSNASSSSSLSPLKFPGRKTTLSPKKGTKATGKAKNVVKKKTRVNNKKSVIEDESNVQKNTSDDNSMFKNRKNIRKSPVKKPETNSLADVKNFTIPIKRAKPLLQQALLNSAKKVHKQAVLNSTKSNNESRQQTEVSKIPKLIPDETSKASNQSQQPSGPVFKNVNQSQPSTSGYSSKPSSSGLNLRKSPLTNVTQPSKKDSTLKEHKKIKTPDKNSSKLEKSERILRVRKQNSVQVEDTSAKEESAKISGKNKSVKQSSSNSEKNQSSASVEKRRTSNRRVSTRIETKKRGEKNQSLLSAKKRENSDPDVNPPAVSKKERKIQHKAPLKSPGKLKSSDSAGVSNQNAIKKSEQDGVSNTRKSPKKRKCADSVSMEVTQKKKKRKAALPDYLDALGMFEAISPIPTTGGAFTDFSPTAELRNMTRCSGAPSVSYESTGFSPLRTISPFCKRSLSNTTSNVSAISTPMSKTIMRKNMRRRIKNPLSQFELKEKDAAKIKKGQRVVIPENSNSSESEEEESEIDLSNLSSQSFSISD